MLNKAFFVNHYISEFSFFKFISEFHLSVQDGLRNNIIMYILNELFR